ncbi:MAG: hypothetical protein K0V04_19150 [Deltaproteobacteria bacterium]|nr:hypothetical protein [Deltaproteobacteria bacterium]
MTLRTSARVWAPALVLVLCAGGLVLASLDPVEPKTQVEPLPAPVLSEAGTSLLGGMQVGERLMGWDVVALGGPHEREIRIELERDGVRFSLMVMVKGAVPQAPPLETEHYAIFYGHVQPKDVSLPSGTIRATTHALARRIRAHETDVVVPGM